MARFTVDPQLIEKAAALVVQPTNEIAKTVEDEAKRLAPPLKTWHTMLDGRVRDPWHVDMEGQQRPDNLRFQLQSHPWDRQHRDVHEFTYMRFPKDVTSRAVVNILNCRCRPLMRKDPDGIRRLIFTEPAVVKELTVEATVVCQGDWVVQSEFGTVYPGDLVAPGHFFMRRAAWTITNKRNRARGRR